MPQTHDIDLFARLIPTGNDFLAAFTTCKSLHIFPAIELVELGDKQLGVHKVSAKTTHKLVSPPASTGSVKSPDLAWEAIYPKGSINPSGEIPGGFGFYLSGPPPASSQFGKLLSSGTVKEAVFSYRMMLKDDWEWVKGGKLPGIFGGVGDLAYSCTGGRQEKRCQCFDLRPMWREKSVGELYAYLPITTLNEKKLSSVPPKSVVNKDYGVSVGRGAYDFQNAVGSWIAVAFRIKLNDAEQNNGELQVWIDGKSVIFCDGLLFRDSKNGKIKGMHFQTFFGGHDKDWASPKEQKAWFSDVTGVILS